MALTDKDHNPNNVKTYTDTGVPSVVLVDDTGFTVDSLLCSVDGVLFDGGLASTDKAGSSISLTDKSK